MRVGTVTAATVPLLAPTIHAFRDSHPTTLVEILTAQQTGIHRALLEGSMDLGLVNYLDGDDMPPEFESTELLRGHPVVCLRPDDDLASSKTIRSADLWGQPLIAMRAGYVMHRYVMRLLDGREPTFSYSADGAEMGKLMVAAGLGIAVLPDYSVVGDPLERSGEITYRPLADDGTGVLLVLQRRRSAPAHNAISDLHDLFVAEARRTRDERREPPSRPPAGLSARTPAATYRPRGEPPHPRRPLRRLRRHDARLRGLGRVPVGLRGRVRPRRGGDLRGQLRRPRGRAGRSRTSPPFPPPTW